MQRLFYLYYLSVCLYFLKTIINSAFYPVVLLKLNFIAKLFSLLSVIYLIHMKLIIIFNDKF